MIEWMNETLYPGWGQRFAIVTELVSHRSDFQDIRILQTASHGRILVLDGNVQITEADEFAYQEMIVHVPLLAHGAARHVLIIGAGDGGVLRRVLMHPSVVRATMVEIDGDIIELCKRHLPMIAAGAWDDPRATVMVGDGIDHVANASDESYDVIIVDSTDPVSVGEVLFSGAFYKECERVLTGRGVIVNQCGVPFMQANELRESSRRRAEAFPHVGAYVAAVPTYVGGFMTLGFAAKVPGLDKVSIDVVRDRAATAGILGTTDYWSPEIQSAAFQLPPYIARQLPSG